MQITIHGRELPGRKFCSSDGRPYDDVRVGIQVRKEPESLVPGDATSACWDVEVDAILDGEGAIDFRGPAVHGKRGERFLYLTWGNIGEDGVFEMFRRAKLMLNRIEPELVKTADQEKRPLIGEIRLSDEHGSPRCARVDPPDLTWSVGSNE